MRAALAALFAALACMSAHAQDAAGFPAKPMRVIVPYTPGGLVDVFARALGAYLTQRLGQPLVMDNRPGASQAIGLELAAKSAPDGYTLVTGTQAGLVFTTAARASLPYDPLRDFAHITTLFDTPFYLVVHPSVPAHSVQEIIAYAKSRPGNLSYASIGVGSGHHLAMELFKMRTGIDVVHVPYKGSPQSMTDLISGLVQLEFEGPVATLPNIRSGKIRALASSGHARTRALPELPTVSEAGVPGFEIAPWFGLSAPAGVPRPIIDRLNREVAAMLNSPAERERFAASNIEFKPSTPEEMTERVRAEIPVWTKVMRAAGIQPE
jgi:tripartite-type tricarboxylate transporter receptor subunit TctC